jgi:hypothetical protein
MQTLQGLLQEPAYHPADQRWRRLLFGFTSFPPVCRQLQFEFCTAPRVVVHSVGTFHPSHESRGFRTYANSKRETSLPLPP